MSTDQQPLIPDSAILTAFGLAAGMYLGGVIASVLLGGFGLVVGYRLDTVRELETEIQELKAELRGE